MLQLGRGTARLKKRLWRESIPEVADLLLRHRLFVSCSSESQKEREAVDHTAIMPIEEALLRCPEEQNVSREALLEMIGRSRGGALVSSLGSTFGQVAIQVQHYSAAFKA